MKRIIFVVNMALTVPDRDLSVRILDVARHLQEKMALNDIQRFIKTRYKKCVSCYKHDIDCY